MEFQSMIRRTKKQKMAALVARFAVDIAKERNDPSYAKYQMYRDKFIKHKLMIGKKYKRDAFIKAKAAMKQAQMDKNKPQ